MKGDPSTNLLLIDTVIVGKIRVRLLFSFCARIAWTIEQYCIRFTVDYCSATASILSDPDMCSILGFNSMTSMMYLCPISFLPHFQWHSLKPYSPFWLWSFSPVFGIESVSKSCIERAALRKTLNGQFKGAEVFYNRKPNVCTFPHLSRCSSTVPTCLLDASVDSRRRLSWSSNTSVTALTRVALILS